MSKTYELMKEEFTNFYNNEIKDILPKYNKFRKKESPKQIVLWSAFF